MNFVKQQNDARKRSIALYCTFAALVVAVIVAIYFPVRFAAAALGVRGSEMHGIELDFSALDFDSWLFFQVFVVTGILILGGSLIKLLNLAGGGRVVAERLGGTKIHRETSDPFERRALNVVEEMSIASGVPVPPLYVLREEEGINAFAAGSTYRDAAVGVTKGALRHLNREQLQGVIAHEFSHILNGDMRINTRMVGLIAGLLVISEFGSVILRAVMQGSRRGRSSRDRKGGAHPAILVLGVGLLVIGWIGALAGRLLRASISRQREYLADASAVQFTRNPAGIAGALKTIGGFTSSSSHVEHPNAEEVSHLFFSSSFSSWFGAVFATHPPLPDRIRRLDPSFNGKFVPIPVEHVAPVEVEASSFSPGGSSGNLVTKPSEGISRGEDKVTLADTSAAGFLASLTPDIRAAVEDPFGARSVIYTILISSNSEVRKAQLDLLNERLDNAQRREFSIRAPLIASLPREYALPLVDLTLPALKELTKDEYLYFRRVVIDLIKSDSEVSIMEYALQRVVLRYLDPHFGVGSSPKIRFYSLGSVRDSVEVLLAVLARYGHAESHDAEVSYRKGFASFGVPSFENVQMPTILGGVGQLDKALKVLEQSSMELRVKILDAALACAGGDMVLTLNEAELIRAIADCFDCPLPPFSGRGEVGI